MRVVSGVERSLIQSPDEAREGGLWDELYAHITAGMTKEQLAELYDWVKLDSLDHGEGWFRMTITQQGWSNVPQKSPSSAGICGQHGVYVGRLCPKCVTQAKP